MDNLYIGIDPGEHTGVAIYDGEKLKFSSMNWWECMDLIDRYIMRGFRDQKWIPHFTVEDPGLNTFIYRQRITSKIQAEALRIAQNVGMNKQDAKRIIERLNQYKVVVEQVRPIAESQKWTHNYFVMMTRFTGERSNEHERDACKLITHRWVDKTQGNNILISEKLDYREILNSLR